VLQSLREALRDKDRRVRWAAAQALGASTSSDPAVLQSLREALRDKDRRVRAAVATVLYRAGVRSPAVRVTLLAEVAFGSPWTDSPWTDTYSMLVSEDEEEEHEEESIVYITPVRGDE
jgi:HEAT repeat protein